MGWLLSLFLPDFWGFPWIGLGIAILAVLLFFLSLILSEYIPAMGITKFSVKMFFVGLILWEALSMIAHLFGSLKSSVITLTTIAIIVFATWLFWEKE